LEHLESVLDKAGSQLLVLCLYTSSCGACQLVSQRLDALCAEAARARTRAVFARHNVIDEYDAWSDIARCGGGLCVCVCKGLCCVVYCVRSRSGCVSLWVVVLHCRVIS
jgi:hypothetical protein